MKKILSLALTLCMLLSMTVFFVSCDAYSIDDIKEDPIGTLSSAQMAALEAFFDDGYGVKEIAGKAAQNGSMKLSFASRMLGSIGDISLTAYTANGKDGALTFAIKEGNKTYDATAFLSEKGIILDCQDLLGTNGPIGIFYDTFEEKFAASDLAKLLEINAEDMAEIKASIAEVITAIEEAQKKEAEALDKTLDELLATLKQTVSNETLDGETCAVITYTLDNETLRAFMQKIPALIGDTEGKLVDMTEVNEALDELDQSTALNLSLKTYISLAEGNLAKVSLTGSVTEKESGMISTVEFFITYAADKITFTGKVVDGEETEEISADIKKTVKDDVSTYTFSATAEGETMELGTYTYNKKDGKFEIALTIEGMPLTVKGEVKTTDKSATVAITSVGSQGMSMDMTLALTFTVDDKAPALSGDTKDLVELTEAELSNIVKQFEQSQLVQILAGIFGGMGDSDIPEIE